MDELSKIAKAYYKASSVHQKKLAQEFFNVMDDDGDRKIDRKEFMKFMSNMGFMNDQGHDHMTRLSFFNQLDLDENGTLDFDEVMRLYYIVKSGRPFCDNCKMFIPTTYFKCTCVRCLEDVGGWSIHLCLDCYTKQKCDHSKNDMSRFLDNYSLLEVMLKSNLSKEKSRPSETILGSDSLALENNTWNPFSSMVQVSNWTPPTVNPHSRSQCPPITPPSGNTYTWNHLVPRVQVLNMPPLNVNHDPWNQRPSFAPPQVLNRPSSITDHPSWNQCVPTTSFQYVPPPVHQHTWIQHNYYHQPPVAATNIIVPEQKGWKEAFEALNAALYVGAIGSVLCSIL